MSVFFKPRIFISSSLKLNNVREKIENVISSVGGEPMLYEHHLTPSELPSSYRYAVHDADFLILILDRFYGTKTTEGLSGTHEEYKIATSLKIPIHVYVREGEMVDEDRAAFLQELQGEEVSYFLYNDDSQLVDRLKHTMLTIGRAVALRRLDIDSVNSTMLRKLTIEWDYRILLMLKRDTVNIKKICDQLGWDYSLINLWVILSDIWDAKGRAIEDEFLIDAKANRVLLLILNSLHKIASQITNNSTPSNSYPIVVQIWGEPFPVTRNEGLTDKENISHQLMKLLARIDQLMNWITSRRGWIDARI